MAGITFLYGLHVDKTPDGLLLKPKFSCVLSRHAYKIFLNVKTPIPKGRLL
jgi:hypothetical protein